MKLSFIHFFLFLLLLALASCDEKILKPHEVFEGQPITGITLSPETAEFEPEMGAKDTTVTVQLTLHINPDELEQLIISRNNSYDAQHSTENSPLPEYMAELIISSHTSDEYVPIILSNYDEVNHTFSTELRFDTQTFNREDYLILARMLNPVESSATVQTTFKIRGFPAGEPYIDSVVHPDTVFIPNSGTVNFTVGAVVLHTFDNDLISETYTNLFDGDGNRLGNQRFVLQLDNSGDTEYFYSTSFQISSENQPDEITIEFFAFDVFGTASDTLTSNFVISR